MDGDSCPSAPLRFLLESYNTPIVFGLTICNKPLLFGGGLAGPDVVGPLPGGITFPPISLAINIPIDAALGVCDANAGGVQSMLPMPPNATPASMRVAKISACLCFSQAAAGGLVNFPLFKEASLSRATMFMENVWGG